MKSGSEEEFAAFAAVTFGCGVNSGTDALVLALRAVDVGPGDEVVVSANTFHATVAEIVLAGATPVLVDADSNTFQMDVNALAAALKPRTKAVVPVHLYGKVMPLEKVCRLADRYGAVVIEDAAQAHGARAAECRAAGAQGLLGCFSFHPSKNLGSAGDGGMVVTSNPSLFKDVRHRRALGQRTRNYHVIVGLNSKLHALQAVVLRAKLPRLEGWNEERRTLAAAYRSALRGLPVAFQRDVPGEQHAYHLFQIRVPRYQRDGHLRHLCADGADAVVRYPVPIHLQSAFNTYGWRRGQFPVAEALSRELLCPPRPSMSDEELAYVVSSVRRLHR